MEKFFTIKPDSQLYTDYFQYLEDLQSNASIFDDFASKHEIGSHKFIPYKKYLVILPTERDKDKFAQDFTQQYFDNGGRQFKVRSEIGKDWISVMNDIKPARKPGYFYLISLVGHFSERLFHIGDTLYGSLRADSEFNLHSCMEEIKASVFYKLIEDYNESLKTKEDKQA